jgi:hypothetical protein
MSGVLVTSIEIGNLTGSFAGGLAGAPGMLRSTQRNKVRAIEFSYLQSGTGNVDDEIVVAELNPTDRLLDYEYTTTVNVASATVEVGLYDRNLHAGAGIPANTEVTTIVDPARSISTAGTFRPSATNILPKQVGSDPAGDESTGNVPLGYGSSTVQVVLTIEGAGLTDATTIKGYLLVSQGN